MEPENTMTGNNMRQAACYLILAPCLMTVAVILGWACTRINTNDGTTLIEAIGAFWTFVGAGLLGFAAIGFLFLAIYKVTS